MNPDTLDTIMFLGLGWQGWFTIIVVFSSFLLCVFTRYSPDMIFLGGLVVLLISGVLNVQQGLSGFSNSGMITVGVLYIVVTGLQQTGGLAWISQRVLGLPRGMTWALSRMVFPVFGMSAFLNNTPVVAMFIPVVKKWSRKIGISASKLMIPLSYAAIFGGICTLIGTSTNLVVNGMLIAETGQKGLKMFDITWVSLPCALVGLVYLVFFSRRFLPDRQSVIQQSEDSRQYSVEMVVDANSPLAGQTIQKAGLRHLPGLFLAEIDREGQILPAVGPDQVLRQKDRLIFVGVVDSIVDLQKFRGLSPATDQVFKLDAPRTERRLIEAVVSNTCSLVGQTIREGKFRTKYNAVVLAVARNAERIKGKIGDITLKPGDSLLLEAHPSFIDKQRLSRDFYLISEVPDSEPMRHAKAPLALAILALMVILASLGVMSMLKAAMMAAALVVMTGCCSMNQARRSIEWQVLLLIGAALGLGKALDESGAAAFAATNILKIAGNNPWMALAMVYIITNFFTEMITHIPAAALVFPIALNLSHNLGVAFLPFAIVIMIAASASFSTPIGYQTNLMVYGPGGYRFSDFIKVGFPLNVLFCITAVIIAPLVYPF